MIVEKIDLYEYFGLSRKEGEKGFLTCYIHKEYDFAKDRIRPAMLIVAGGGYSHLSEREKQPVAFKYMENGFNCFILDYSTAPECYPTQQFEAVMAMIFIRKNARKFRLDAKKVVALGFSAGAHLCGMLATVTEDEMKDFALKEAIDFVRPNALVLGYPVVSGVKSPHVVSFANLTNNNKSLYGKLSLENRVDKNTPPSFIWGCLDDPVVPSDNGFLLAKVYKRMGIPFEYHLFENCNGIHGLSICEKETLYENETVRVWLQLSKNWLKNRGFEVK